MKKQITLIFLVAIASIMTACAQNKDTYVSLSQTDASDTSGTSLSSDSHTDSHTDVFSDYKFDDKNNRTIANSAMTFDDQYLYNFSVWGAEHMRIKLDLKSGEIVPLCDIPACSHQTSDCINNWQIQNPIAVSDEIWHLEKNQLISLVGREKTVLFTNTYSTEFEKINYPDMTGDDVSPDQRIKNAHLLLSGFMLTEDTIYAYGPSYVFTINRDTMKAGEPIKISDNIIYSMCVHNNIAYVANDVNELYMVDFDTRNVTKLGDKIVNPSVSNEMLYYVKWIDSMPWLYSASLDGTDEQQILEDCYVNYYIRDNSVFYSQFVADKDAAYLYFMDTKQKQLLYDERDERVNEIVSASYIDRVFAITEDKILSWRVDGSDFVSFPKE